MKKIIIVLLIAVNLFGQKCELWNNLQNNSGKSIIGSNGVIYGTPFFNICRFNRGMYTINNTDYIIYITTILQNSAGCVEFWFKPNFGPGSADGARFFISNKEAYQTGFAFYLQIVGANTYWAYDYGGIEVSLIKNDYAVDELIHIGLVWDAAKGIDGSKSLSLRRNNIEIGNSTNNLGTIVEDICLGKDYTNNFMAANAVIDNIKIWNYAKTDFSDRFKEAFRQTGHYQ